MHCLENKVKPKLKFLLNRRKNQQTLQMDINLGLGSSLIIAIIETTLFFLQKPEDGLFYQMYLIAGITMIIQFGLFLRIFLRKKEDLSFMDTIIIKAYPYFIMALGVAISAIHVGYDNQITPFVLAMVAAAIVSYQKPLQSIILYSLSLMAFILVLGLVQVDSTGQTLLIRNALFFTFIAIFYSYISSSRHKKELISNLQAVNEKVTRSNQITNAMMQIMTEILRFEHIDDFFEIVLETAIKLIPSAQKGSVLLINGDVLEYRAAHGYNFEQLKKIKLKLEETFQHQLGDIYSPTIIKNLELFHTKNVSIDKVAEFRKQDALIAKSILSCAFSLKGKFYGSINLDNIEDENAFGEEDKILIKHLATQIEIALANKILVDNILLISRHDALTNAYTRIYFDELLNKYYNTCAESNSIFSICIIDANDLKQINDYYGHHIGDDFLKYFSRLVQENLQNKGIFGRSGGDEFTIMFPNLCKEEATKILISIHQASMVHPFIVEGKEILEGFSYGIAEYPTDSNELNTIFKIADNRMYQYKEQVKSKK